MPTFLWMGGWIGEVGFRELKRKEKEDEEVRLDEAACRRRKVSL